MSDKRFFNIVSNGSEKAVIEINGVIGDWDWDEDNGWHVINSGKAIREQLKDIGDVKDLEVLITSMGGDVDHALQIHDALKDHPATVTTIINGFCASAATIIALAGDVRKISRNAVYLIHKCSSWAVGNEHDLQKELESQQTVNDVLYNMYKGVCKKKEEDLVELFNYDNGHGKWITAQEVVDFGFCDEIYNGETDAVKVALVDRALLEKLGCPQFPNNSELQDERLMNRIIEKMREIFAPKENTIINQIQEPMKKFNEQFAMMALVLAELSDIEYSKEQGLTITDDQLHAIEDRLATMQQEKEQLENKNNELNSQIESLTSERDDYKNKWENAPAPNVAVQGSDNGGECTLDGEYYDSIERELQYM